MVVIGFSRQRNFTSWLIRKVTRGAWSHVYVDWNSTFWKGRWVTHAQPEGVVTQPIEVLRKKYQIRLEYGIDDDLIRSGMVATRAESGRGYDTLTAFYNGMLLIIFYITNWQFLWKLTARDTTRFTCSEYVILIMKRAGLKGADQLDAELTTPGQLEEFCARSEQFHRLLPGEV